MIIRTQMLAVARVVPNAYCIGMPCMSAPTIH